MARDGLPADLPALAAIDPLLREEAWRERLVCDALASGGCMVAEAAGAPPGWVHGLDPADPEVFYRKELGGRPVSFRRLVASARSTVA